MQSKLIYTIFNYPYDRVVNVRASGAEVWGSNPGSVKAETALPTAHHHCAIYFKEAVLLRRVDGLP